MKVSLHRLMLFCCVLLVLGALVIFRRYEKVWAYSDKTTHVQLAERTVELAASGLAYRELKPFAEIIAKADQAEDAGSRGDNHFFDPKTRGGLATSSTVRMIYNPVKGGIPILKPSKIPGGQKAADGLPHYISALDWATDQMGMGPGLDGTQKELDWKGAIEAYDYTREAKRDAYEAAGHVLHLLQDMGQPDHVTLRVHPCNYLRDWLGAVLPDRAGYESLWEREDKSWSAGKTAVSFKTLDEAFLKLAYESRDAEDQLGLPMKDEIALGCGKPTGLKTLSVAVPIESLSTEAAGIYDIVEWPIAGHLNERFYSNTWNRYEFNGIPAVPMIPWPPGDSRTQKYLALGKTLLPRVEEYGAGLLRLFYDIVNPPPFVEEVQIYQQGKKRYSKWWEDQKNGDRVVSRKAKNEGDGALDSGVEATLYVWFAPWVESESVSFDRKNMVLSPTVTLLPDKADSEERTKIILEPRGPEFGPDPRSGPFWIGKFTPVGSATLQIDGTDLNHHFRDSGGKREESLTPMGGKRGTQGQLDADPSTPARASWPEPYLWKGYEAGPDTNHHFTVKGGACPILAQMQWGKWSVTYTRAYAQHTDTETCHLPQFACESPAAYDPKTHSNYYHPCSDSYTEHEESKGYVFSAWPYPGSGDVVCFYNCERIVKVHFPWSQVQPDDFREIRFASPAMNDATISTKHDSTCAEPEAHITNVMTRPIAAREGQRTQCDIQSINYHDHSSLAKDASGRELEIDEEFKYSFEPVEPPAHFRVVSPISFNLDDLSGAADAFVSTIVAKQSAACGNAPKERVKSCYEAYIPLMQLRSVLVRDAENQWGELARSFKEADELWWRRAPAADYEGKLAQLKVAASSWQGLSSTIPHHLSISVDNLAQAIGQWNSHAADELRAIARKLRGKGLDFPGLPSTP